MKEGFEKGLVIEQGLIAHGRGEAFDYILGERTIPAAARAENAAAAFLVLAENPVISVNGNVAALAAREVVKLSKSVPAILEVNLFYRTEKRVQKVAECLRAAGAKEVLGTTPDARIPGFRSKRGLCSRDGIYSADVVLVPLEDGDRAEALSRMGKVVLAVDLNPMSRTSIAATVTIVNELTRTLPDVTKAVRRMKRFRASARRVASSFDNKANLSAVLKHMNARLSSISR